jgi:hypothetical protein
VVLGHAEFSEDVANALLGACIHKRVMTIGGNDPNDRLWNVWSM